MKRSLALAAAALVLVAGRTPAKEAAMKAEGGEIEKLAGFEAPDSIQAGESSMAGGMDGFTHACGSVLVNVNWNDVNRNWNVNAWNPNNDVNAGRRVFSGN